MKPTDTSEFINSLNAGVFAQQVGRILSDVAAGVVEFGKAGEVTIKFKMKQIAQSNQVAITHTWSFLEPSKYGDRTEKHTLDTPMYVTTKGLELFQNDPTAQLFKKEDTPVLART